MMPPTSIDGTDISGATIDGQDVQQITVDGQTVFTAGPDITIVDDYEDGDISEYAGDTGNASIISSDPLEGSNSLEHTQDAGSVVFSTSGLANYPQQGQNFACLTEARNGDGATPCYGLEDTNNFYAVSVEVSSNRLRFFEVDGGSLTVTLLATPTLSGGQVYDVDVQWQSDNTHNIELYEWDEANFERGSSVASGSISSTAASGTGIGFRGGGSNRQAIYDFYRIIQDL